MPTLQLKIAPLQNPEQYRRLAQALTALAADHLGKRPEVTAVVMQDLPAAQWFVAGHAVQRPTALLEIDITAGTNTPAEKAAFIEAAHAELRRQLGAGGELETASYVIVHELPATDWGYDGRTQRARQLERERAVAA
jgi:4-oxalocrotonate tautomerase